MDAFYEESAINQNGARGEKIYKLLNICYYVSLVISIFALVSLFTNTSVGNPENLEGDALQAYQFSQAIVFISGAFLCVFGTLAVGLFLTKRRVNISYDYVFVSGELRISKVFNVNHRRLLARIDCQDMVQVGDVDNPSFERFCADPTNKKVICTPNAEPSKGKFFMYVLADYEGRKLFVLECRESLLTNIMKFAKRSVLESDYVMQEKKQK